MRIDTVRGWRHHLHQHPETAFGERSTSEFVAAGLRDLGFDVTTGIGGTGVVGSLTRGRSGRAIGLRSDMDALPLDERAGHAHASLNPGAMHACGHDGHMAMLLGAAAALADDSGFDGIVRAIFQPAEEPGRGAQAMLDDGLLERFPVDSLYGLHNLPGLAAGHFQTRPGPIMAAEDNFRIQVIGRGGHASSPHLVIDPLVVGAEIVLALQQIVARSVDPLAAAVVSCTDLRTDGARNAIPTTVHITGDTRSFEPGVQTLLERRIREISTGIAGAHGATVEITYTHEFAPTVNDAGCAANAAAAAASVLGTGRVDGSGDAIMASEDFGVFATHVPACFSFLGNGKSAAPGGVPLHSHDYDFNDEILPAGIAFYTELVHRTLAPR
jgi:amidohydrolase